MKTRVALAVAAALGVSCGSGEAILVRGANGPIQIGGTVVAADASTRTVMVQRLDGRVWVYEATPDAAGSFDTLRAGDAVILTFDASRGRGRVVRALETRMAFDMPPGSDTEMVSLPFGIMMGTPATQVALAGPTTLYSNRGALGSGVATLEGGIPLAATGGIGALLAVPGPVFTTGFTNGTRASAATAVTGIGMPAAGTPAAVGQPLPTGAQTRPVITGPFTPGTVAPGVTQTQVPGATGPGAPTVPVITGPFTPGTIAPGVQQQTVTPTAPTTPQATTPAPQPRTDGSTGTANTGTTPTTGSAPAGTQPQPGTQPQQNPQPQQPQRR